MNYNLFQKRSDTIIRSEIKMLDKYADFLPVKSDYAERFFKNWNTLEISGEIPNNISVSCEGFYPQSADGSREGVLFEYNNTLDGPIISTDYWQSNSRGKRYIFGREPKKGMLGGRFGEVIDPAASALLGKDLEEYFGGRLYITEIMPGEVPAKQIVNTQVSKKVSKMQAYVKNQNGIFSITNLGSQKLKVKIDKSEIII